MFPANLTTEQAAIALSDSGFAVSARDLTLDPRGERTVVMMPGARAAWFARSEAGRAQLGHEARVLRLLAERCSFEVPRVLFESTDVALQVRALVPGETAPFERYHEAQASPEKARMFASSVGALLAEQHMRIRERDGAGWVRRTPAWPLRLAQARETLSRVVSDDSLRAHCERVLAMSEAVDVDPADCVLIHGDLGFHNSCSIRPRFGRLVSTTTTAPPGRIATTIFDTCCSTHREARSTTYSRQRSPYMSLASA